MRRLQVCLILFAFSFTDSFAQEIDWIDFEKLVEKMRAQPKPVLIFIYTDWCRFCSLQEERTFTDSLVVSKIQRDFYAVSLNAEQKKEIIFLNKRYQYKPSGMGAGYHELAELLGKKGSILSFPTTVILSASLQSLGMFQGFLNATDLQRLLEDVR